MLIKRIHDLITFLAREEQSGYITPEKKDQAINAASSEFFTDQVKDFETTGRLSEHLRPFKTVATVALTSGAGSLPGDFSRELAVVSDDNYKGYLVPDEQFESNEWAKFLEERPELAHLTRKELSFATYSTPVSLPKNLRKGTGIIAIISGNQHKGYLLSDEDWMSRDVKLFRAEDGSVDPALKSTATIALTSGAGDLPADLVMPTGISVIDGGIEYSGRILSDEEWVNKEAIYTKEMEGKSHQLQKEVATIALTSGIGDLPADFVGLVDFRSVISGSKYSGKVIEDGEWPKRDISLCLGPDGEVESHYKQTIDITLTSGVADLPQDFIEHIEFTSVVDGSPRVEYEGEVLNDNKFEELKSDTVYPRTVENPIARIYNGKIEVFPATVAKIKLHFIQYPTEKRPIARVYNNKIEVAPLGVTSVEIQYTKQPSARRPVARVTGDTVHVYPSSITSVNLHYGAFPVEKSPIARVYNNKIEVAPTGVGSIKIQYTKQPSARRPVARVTGDTVHVYPSSITSVKLHYVAFPTTKRPIARLRDDKLEILPLGVSGKLLYEQFPTEKAFVARVTGSQVEVNPDTIASVSLTYLKKPTVGIYGYTVAGDGRSFVYDSGTSTDLNWTDVSFKELSMRSLKYLGIPLRESTLIQFGLQDKAMK